VKSMSVPAGPVRHRRQELEIDAIMHYPDVIGRLIGPAGFGRLAAPWLIINPVHVAGLDMKTTQVRKQTMLALAMLTCGFAGGAVTIAHVGAAPVKVSEGVNTSDEPIVHSATYVPETLAMYVLRGPADNPLEKPMFLLSSRVIMEVVFPGRDTIIDLEVFGHMYLDPQAEEVPAAMQMHLAEDGIVCIPIPTEDAEKGMLQMKRGFEQASSSDAAE